MPRNGEKCWLLVWNIWRRWWAGNYRFPQRRGGHSFQPVGAKEFSRSCPRSSPMSRFGTARQHRNTSIPLAEPTIEDYIRFITRGYRSHHSFMRPLFNVRVLNVVVINIAEKQTTHCTLLTFFFDSRNVPPVVELEFHCRLCRILATDAYWADLIQPTTSHLDLYDPL